MDPRSNNVPAAIAQDASFLTQNQNICKTCSVLSKLKVIQLNLPSTFLVTASKLTPSGCLTFKAFVQFSSKGFNVNPHIKKDI